MKLITIIALLYLCVAVSGQNLIIPGQTPAKPYKIIGGENTVYVDNLSSINMFRGGVRYYNAEVNYIDQADSLFVRMSEVGYIPSTLVKSVYNNALSALVDSGLWDETDVLQVYRCEDSLSSLLNWYSRSFNATLVNHSNFKKNAYWITDSATSYINTTFAPSEGTKYTQDDAGFIIKQSNQYEEGYAFGNYTSSSSRTHFLNNASGAYAAVAVNGTSVSTTGISTTTLTDKVGYWAGMRYRSDSIRIYKDSYTVNRPGASATLSVKDIHVGHINGLANFSNPRLQLFWAGGYLSAKQYTDFMIIMDKFFFELDCAIAENVENHGAVPDGSTDNYLAIQNLINIRDQYAIRIGNNRLDTFLISKPIQIPSNRTLVIDGVVKTKNATITTITQNVALLATDIYVTSTAGFNVGEFIACSDDDQDVQGGGIQTRKRGNSGIITGVDVENNKITIDYGVRYALTAASNAKLGHQGTVFYIPGSVKNINIYGDGVIDGNYANQYDCYALYNGPNLGEPSGCGIFIIKVDNMRLWGRTRIEFKNTAMHNISFSGITNQSNFVDINKVYAHAAHDKNLLLYNCKDFTIQNSIFNDALFEDGIILYAVNARISIDNVTCNNNMRFGLSVNNNTDVNLVGSELTLTDNKSSNLWIASNEVSLTDITIYNTTNFIPRFDAMRITDQYIGGNNVSITNLSISNINAAGKAVISLLGDIDGGTFNNCTISGCTDIAIKSATGSYAGLPQNITFNNGGLSTHTGTKTDIAVGSDVTFTNFTGLD